MTVSSIITGGRRSVMVVRADVPTLTAPSIVRKFKAGGVNMYEGHDGKLYHADLYDKMFKVQQGRVLPRNMKGANCNVKLRY